MSTNPQGTSGAAVLCVRSTITTVLLLMIAVMIVRDIFAHRRDRLRGRSRRDISLVVR
ncbi:MAG: hypothetical protein ABI192_20775 [Bradyrhizobium sp.]